MVPKFLAGSHPNLYFGQRESFPLADHCFTNTTTTNQEVVGDSVATISHVNMVKLCVGIDSLEHLRTYRAQRQADCEAQGVRYESSHVTRMTPKRREEMLNGGSLYWIIKGFVAARQTILRLDEVIGHDGIKRCAIVMDNKIIPTQSAARRPFQGWRYLSAEDAPPDLPQGREAEDELPPELALALAEIGLM